MKIQMVTCRMNEMDMEIINSEEEKMPLAAFNYTYFLSYEPRPSYWM